jgi:hypothetical protein
MKDYRHLSIGLLSLLFITPLFAQVLKSSLNDTELDSSIGGLATTPKAEYQNNTFDPYHKYQKNIYRRTSVLAKNTSALSVGYNSRKSHSEYNITPINYSYLTFPGSSDSHEKAYSLNYSYGFGGNDLSLSLSYASVDDNRHLPQLNDLTITYLGKGITDPLLSYEYQFFTNHTHGLSIRTSLKPKVMNPEDGNVGIRDKQFTYIEPKAFDLGTSDTRWFGQVTYDHVIFNDHYWSSRLGFYGNDHGNKIDSYFADLQVDLKVADSWRLSLSNDLTRHRSESYSYGSSYDYNSYTFGIAAQKDFGSGVVASLFYNKTSSSDPSSDFTDRYISGGNWTELNRKSEILGASLTFYSE